MLDDLSERVVDWLVPKYLNSNAFALTTRDKNGRRLKDVTAISREETLDRLSEINQQIGKMKLIAQKAAHEFRGIKIGTPEANKLAKKCTLALENCARISIQNDMLLETIHSSIDPFLMDRKHNRYAEQLDQIATTLSSIVKTICDD